ncbi:hypothetical protein P378_00040 [Desulforamulus profundi]|uniref:Core-binding (CB) domain-containing protein n=1 Tax=Desulforamulus profundi TaxID=1383067 RepID=A0A2C6MJC3_9FIRM|nr:hypothetical protein [Desulforamulus profundi]PHJ39944.1 hypothetical protein P378_00040 [Desulforamulus profundi]
MKNGSGNTLREFFQELYSGGAARSTVDAYQKDMAYFSKWYVDTYSREPRPEDITSIDLREYQGYMQNIQGLKPPRSTAVWLPWRSILSGRTEKDMLIGYRLSQR